jgi:hypothetical protein
VIGEAGGGRAGAVTVTLKVTVTGMDGEAEVGGQGFLKVGVWGVGRWQSHRPTPQNLLFLPPLGGSQMPALQGFHTLRKPWAGG